MRGQTRDLLALQVRDLERLPVRGRPDRLHHVSEVEAPALEGAMAQEGEGTETGGVGDDPAGHHHPG
jgi:hypothetical protein